MSPASVGGGLQRFSGVLHWGKAPVVIDKSLPVARRAALNVAK